MNTTRGGARTRDDDEQRPGKMSDARFLLVFMAYTAPGEWVTCATLAERILPRLPSSEFCKEISRKLSNLNRFGHLERRRVPPRELEFEYRRTLDAPAVKPKWWPGWVGGVG